MAWPSTIAKADFWSATGSTGDYQQWRFDGPDGLDLLTGPQMVVSPSAEQFHAQLTRLQLHDFALEYYRATAHRLTRDSDQIHAFPTPLLTVIHVLRGEIEVQLPTSSFTVASGHAFLADTRLPISCSTSDDVEMLRAIAHLDALPPIVDTHHEPCIAALAPTPLLNSFVAFASATLRSAAQGTQIDTDHLAHAALQLHGTIVSDAQQHADDQNGPPALRQRILQHIDRHYTDQNLDVRKIATAIGISPRHAHGVYNNGPDTISRAIRTRRLRAVLDELETNPRPHRLNDLARRFGFSSAEHLRRTFLATYNTTPALHITRLQKNSPPSTDETL